MFGGGLFQPDSHDSMMFLDEILRIRFVSLSLCFIEVNGLLCFSLIVWRLDELLYDAKY